MPQPGTPGTMALPLISRDDDDGNLDTFWNVHHILDFILKFHVCVCVCVCVLSHNRLFVTPWTVAHQAPLSMGFPVSIMNITAINIHLQIFVSASVLIFLGNVAR